jgi:uncharacterized protein YtpQ (UPF0354 family)
MEEARRHSTSDDDLPIVEPLVGELVVAYAFDLPGSFVMVSSFALRELGMDPGDLWPLALENLVGAGFRIDIHDLGPVKQVVTGRGLEACSLLIPGIWDQLSVEMGGDLVAAVPARDVVLACAMADEVAVEVLAGTADDAYHAQTTHRLTLEILTWQGERWHLLDDLAAD